MKIDLSGKRAVVSGSTAGIGFAIAAGLAGAGAAVVLNGRKEHSVREAVARLAGQIRGARVEGIAADLATADGAARFIDKIPAADILVNNLGIFDPKPFGEIPDSD